MSQLHPNYAASCPDTPAESWLPQFGPRFSFCFPCEHRFQSEPVLPPLW